MENIPLYYHIDLEKLREKGFIDTDILVKEKDSLPKPSTMEIDTLGSYIFGCDLANYGDIGGECSLFCMNSLFHEDSGYNSCDHQVWSYFEGKLEQRQKAVSKHAYIFINRNGEDQFLFKGLSMNAIHELSSKGVERASLILTEKGKHKIITEDNIYNLPTTIDYREGFTIDLLQNKETKEKESFISQMQNDPVLLILFIIVVIGFVLFFIF